MSLVLRDIVRKLPSPTRNDDPELNEEIDSPYSVGSFNGPALSPDNSPPKTTTHNGSPKTQQHPPLPPANPAKRRKHINPQITYQQG